MLIARRLQPPQRSCLNRKSMSVVRPIRIGMITLTTQFFWIPAAYKNNQVLITSRPSLPSDMALKMRKHDTVSPLAIPHCLRRVYAVANEFPRPDPFHPFHLPVINEFFQQPNQSHPIPKQTRTHCSSLHSGYKQFTGTVLATSGD